MSLNDVKDLLPPSLAALARHAKQLARLWAGYGYIYRIELNPSGSSPAACILKYVSPPASDADGADEGTTRKLASYRVEANFYENLAEGFNDANGPSRTVPAFLARPSSSGLIIADLALSHPLMPPFKGGLNLSQTVAALDWFAAFHAHFWAYKSETGRECDVPTQLMKQKGGVESWKGEGVWRIGTYNYLQTRLVELDAIPRDGPFAELRGPLAYAVEALLQNPQQVGMTLVHGDAKSANMALRKIGTETTADSLGDWGDLAGQWEVCMFDFQYVGGGVGTQDLIKFFATAINEALLVSNDGKGEEDLLRFYHQRLTSRLSAKGHTEPAKSYPFSALWRHWELSLVSWVRFTQGWGSWGNVEWLERRGESILSDSSWKEAVLSKHPDLT